MTDFIPASSRPLLEKYLQLLDRWNQTHALTALPPEARWEELILDASQLLPFIEPLPAGARVADFGTGMGIPAAVLAIVRPDLHILALDKVSKKLAFLRQVRLELQLNNLEPIAGRIEALPPLGAHVGTSKATGPLSLLAGWWEHHGQPQAPFLAFKGPEWTQEARPEGWALQAHPYTLPTRGDRVLIQMQKTPA